MSIQKTFAANMKKYRKRYHLTQERLAEKSGLHRTYIGGIEQNRVNVSLKNIEKIATALDIDPALLFIHEDTSRAEFKRSAEPTSFSTPNKTKRTVAIESPERSSKVGETAAKDASERHSEAFSKYDYALCTWTDDGIDISPINVDDEQLTISILCALINNGYSGDLAEAYESTRRQLLAYFRSQNPSLA